MYSCDARAFNWPVEDKSVCTSLVVALGANRGVDRLAAAGRLVTMNVEQEVRHTVALMAATMWQAIPRGPHGEVTVSLDAIASAAWQLYDAVRKMERAAPAELREQRRYE